MSKEILEALQKEENKYQKELERAWIECFTTNPEKAKDLMQEKGTAFLGFPVYIRDYMPKDKVLMICKDKFVIFHLSSSQ